MELLVENPTASKFVLKYIPKTHKFILKVTDGYQIVLKKCKAEVKLLLFRSLKRSKSSLSTPDVHLRTRATRRQSRWLSRTRRMATRRRTKRKGDTATHLFILNHFSYRTLAKTLHIWNTQSLITISIILFSWSSIFGYKCFIKVELL